MRLFSCIAATLLLSSSLISHADTLAGINTGTTAGNDGFYGQAFTSSENANNIAFNYYANGSPYAIGSGFLFSQPYTGVAGPIGLNSLDTGYLGTATASGGFYTFAPSLTLLANTQYVFYSSSDINSISGGDPYAGGDIQFSVGGAFTDIPGVSANFLVTGNSVRIASPAPEPSSLILIGTGILGLAGAVRRRLV